VQQLTIGGQPQTPGEFTPLPVLLWNLKVGGWPLALPAQQAGKVWRIDVLG
jgi:hypothetical protein